MRSNIIQGNTFFLSLLARFLDHVDGLHPNWKLCYRASAHGWAASTFHSRCDGKRNTVTIIKKDQYVFGGFTDISWGMDIILEIRVSKNLVKVVVKCIFGWRGRGVQFC